MSHPFRPTLITLILVACLLPAAAALAQDNEPAIKNGSFSEWTGGKPAGWIVRKNKQELSQATDLDHDTAQTSLQVDVVKDGGGSYGEILQKLKLKPATRYRISGDLKSTGGGEAFFQVKTIRSKKELERLTSEKSDDDEWKSVSIEFDTAGADEVQVLCRYKQKADQVGSTLWWTNLTIEELGAGEPPRDPQSLEIAPQGRNMHVTPTGSGARDGSNWDNARAADDLQSALDSVGPGQTLLLGSGEYRDVRLTLAAGGASDASRVTIRGVDTGDGLPRFVSDFDKHNPGNTGGTLLRIDSFVGFVSVEHLRIEDYQVAIVMNGPNRGVRIDDVDATRVREGVVVNGGAVPNMADSGTNDLAIRNCDIGPYIKRAVRIRGGVHDVRIEDCHADAGGKEWATERFAMGFTVEGSKAEGILDHDITYVRCTSRNNYDDNGKGYWNADGFAAERGAANITYRDCGAFDNTDGGWDVKAENPTFINCVSLRNKRNFRVWSKAETPARFTNCVAAFSEHRGGSGNRNGLHLTKGAAAIVDDSTFTENGQSVDLDAGDRTDTAVTLTRCLVYEPDGLSDHSELAEAKVVFIDSVVIDSRKGEGEPSFVDARASWEGGNDAMNSKTYPEVGYRYQRIEPF